VAFAAGGESSVCLVCRLSSLFVGMLPLLLLLMLCVCVLRVCVLGVLVGRSGELVTGSSFVV
jgi:hypothetical protein